jgi:hypothetical protein
MSHWSAAWDWGLCCKTGTLWLESHLQSPVRVYRKVRSMGKDRVRHSHVLEHDHTAGRPSSTYAEEKNGLYIHMNFLN